MKRSLIPGHNNNRHLTHDELENNIGGLPVTEPKIRELFDAMDVNRNGVLDFNEVKKFYKSFETFGHEYSDKEINDHIRYYAKSPDNLVSFDEFACLVLSLARR